MLEDIKLFIESDSVDSVEYLKVGQHQDVFRLLKNNEKVGFFAIKKRNAHGYYGDIKFNVDFNKLPKKTETYFKNLAAKSKGIADE